MSLDRFGRARTLLALSLAACSAPGTSQTDTGLDASAEAGLPVDSGPDDVADPRPDLSYAPVPWARVVETGIRREVFRLAAPHAPVNPVTMRETPAQLDRVQIVRYRADAPTPRPARAIVLMMPGFLGGAGSFDRLARALVRRSLADGDGNLVEAWAIDRRSNLLEDLRGMEAATSLDDPTVATRYYLERSLRLGGQAFAGFPSATDAALSNLSEWGLAVTLNDVRAAVLAVGAPRDHVVLVGHSLGASVTEAYAGWDFDGTPGYSELAGYVLVDGALPGTTVTEAQYTTTGVAGVGGSSPGIQTLRARGPFYTALPLLGLEANVVSEIVALHARRAPDEVRTEPARDRLFRVLYGLSSIPALSNAAALGFAFDQQSCPLSFARMSLGAFTGGTVNAVNNPFGFGAMETILVPSDRAATYRWVDGPDAMPPEPTTLRGAADAWSSAPTNFPEWYFPTRLPTDLATLGGMTVTATDWQWREGLRASNGGRIDAPVLVIGAALAGSSGFAGVRSRLAATVGAGRPAEGATRDDPRGFRAFVATGMAHLDPLTAEDVESRNPVPAAVMAFVRTHTRGSVTVPLLDGR